MKHVLLCLAAASLLLAGCNRPPSDNAATPAATTTAPAPPAPAAKPRPHRITAEEISQIEATGKTGLWSDVTEVCAKDAKTGLRANMTWNVKASGAEKVVLYVVGKDGTEHNFSRGGPVGSKQTGPWLKPGTVFKLRGQDKKELGSITIGEKQC